MWNNRNAARVHIPEHFSEDKFVYCKDTLFPLSPQCALPTNPGPVGEITHPDERSRRNEYDGGKKKTDSRLFIFEESLFLNLYSFT